MKILILATAAVTLTTTPVALAAAGGNGNGRGQAAAHANVNANVGARIGGNSTAARADGAWSVNSAGVATNPSGKVMPKGLPPGQARKMNQNLAVGSVLSTRYPGYQVITRTDRYNLPVAPAGYEYVRVGNDAYLRQTNSGSIARVIENLFR
jgi:Ni/Co efflux regulator RcnB